MLCLVATYEQTSVRLPVAGGTMRLGSSADNDLRVTFPGISRLHAFVERVPEGLRLRDAGSKNQFYLDGRRVPEVVLSPGMVVQVGRAFLSVDEISSADTQIGIAVAPATESTQPPQTIVPALALVRLLETNPRIDLQFAIGRVRDVLGADTVVVASNEPDLPLLASSGPLLDDSQSWFDTPAGLSRTANGTLFCARSAARLLIATFPSIAEQWQVDLCEFVAAKVLSVPPAHEATDETGRLRIPPEMVIGDSPAMRALRTQLEATISTRLDVVLTGETGTGKELLARVIHDSGPTKNGPFVAINCAAIPAELLEAELFGVARRVATGVDPRPGRFQQANGGTILLDEIGELAAPLQAKLLRVLQEREVLPLGAAKPERIHVRVIAATNRDLLSLTRAGEFRSDLYYRLRGLQFHLPPLRERREDIPALVAAFAQRAATVHRRSIRGVSRKVVRLLMQHDWPGNIRELQREVERAVLLCSRGGVVQAEHLDLPAAHEDASIDGVLSLRQQIERAERDAIVAALRASNGNKSKAARLLGITRNGLALKLARLGIAQ